MKLNDFAKWFTLDGRWIATIIRPVRFAGPLKVCRAVIQSLNNAKNLQESDSALMMSFASGDVEGFNLLYRRYSESIYRFFYFGTHADKMLSAELFYDVWMSVVRGRMRYTNDIVFRDWLYHCAWARLHDHLRLHALDDEIDNEALAKSKSTVVSITDFVADSGNTESKESLSHSVRPAPSSEISVNEDDENTSLVEAVKKLAPEQKEVVLLRYCFSMSSQDIADFIDVSKSAVDRFTRDAAGLLRQKVVVAHAQGDQFNG